MRNFDIVLMIKTFELIKPLDEFFIGNVGFEVNFFEDFRFVMSKWGTKSINSFISKSTLNLNRVSPGKIGTPNL